MKMAWIAAVALALMVSLGSQEVPGQVAQKVQKAQSSKVKPAPPKAKPAKKSQPTKRKASQKRGSRSVAAASLQKHKVQAVLVNFAPHESFQFTSFVKDKKKVHVTSKVELGRTTDVRVLPQGMYNSLLSDLGKQAKSWPPQSPGSCINRVVISRVQGAKTADAGYCLDGKQHTWKRQALIKWMESVQRSF